MEKLYVYEIHVIFQCAVCNVEVSKTYPVICHFFYEKTFKQFFSSILQSMKLIIRDRHN